jgi:hypothetical protein
MVGSRYQLESVAYIVLVFWVMVNVHMDVLICVLCNKTANRFNILELWFLIRPEDGYKISETCRPVNN